MIFIETTLWSITGLVVGFFAFTIGGTMWAIWNIRSIDPELAIHGPVLWATYRLLARGKIVTFALATVIAGGPGVGLVLKKQNSDKAVLLAGIASTIYACLWLVIHALRPQMGIPVEVWPSGEFLNNLNNFL